MSFAQKIKQMLDRLHLRVRKTIRQRDIFFVENV